jgi:hypothetical protein
MDRRMALQPTTKEKTLSQLRKRLTYANVMSSIAVFFVLGGGAAYAAKKIGSNQLKANSVTTAKIKKNAVTGAKVKESTLGTVPNSAATDVIKTSKGTVAGGQQATVFEHGPIKLIVKCEPREVTKLAAHAYIESSSAGTVFTSWQDGSKELGPSTPEDERELNNVNWGGVSSSGPYNYDSASDVGVSATAASGQSFTAFVGVAAEKDSNTCWYWSTATIIS